jgi:hypothetical protein
MAGMASEPIELEPATGIRPRPDRRPRVPEPLPVWLVAVADVRLPGGTGQEVALDRFYNLFLGLQRSVDPVEGFLVYHADNFDLIFKLDEMPIEHDTLTPTRIDVPSLFDLSVLLRDNRIEFHRTRSLLNMMPQLVVQDPAGNWLAVGERRLVG